MLFINFSSEIAASFKYKYHELAKLYKGDSFSFLMVDIDAGSHALKVLIIIVTLKFIYSVYVLFVWLFPFNMYVQ